MVLFSTLVAAVGLLGFALVALGFYQRELRRNLERDLRGALMRTAPVIMRSSGPDLTPRESRFAGKMLGRLEEFGAEYAVYRSGEGWNLGPDWPIEDTEILDRLIPLLAKGPVRPGGNNRLEEGPGRLGRRDQDPSIERNGVPVFRGGELPRGWLFAGVAADHGAVVLAVPDAIHRPQMRRLFVVFGLASPVALGLVALCAWFFSSRAIAPIRKLTRVAASTTADDLSHRISGEGMEREFRELIEVFNGMLERLEKSFGQARRFGQDAAHELNTPLTILTAKVDEAVAEAEDGSEDQQRLGEVSDELGRLGEIVRKLHLLARIDGGGLRPDRIETDLSEVVRALIEEMIEAFPSIRFEWEAGQSIRALCDPSLVRQIVLNLLSNAVNYNRAGGTVDVRLDCGAGKVELRVRNTGPAIEESFRDEIFDRFTRGDSSRTGQNGSAGLGLGLSLSREFARAQGGDLVLESGEEDSVTFLLTIPQASL